MLDDVQAPRFPGAMILGSSDHELVEAARAVLVKHYRPFWHTVAAALRGRDGRIWTGIHLGATVGRLAICAEAIAIGRAVMDGDGTIETVVALRHPKPEESIRDIAIVSPCGACRENILDFDRDALVIVETGGGLRKVPVSVLLPLPYRR